MLTNDELLAVFCDLLISRLSTTYVLLNDLSQAPDPIGLPDARG